MGNPEYVQIMINPNEKTILVERSCGNDVLSHNTKMYGENIQKCFELYSNELCLKIEMLCPFMKKRVSYRFGGFIESDADRAKFFLEELSDNGDRGRI